MSVAFRFISLVLIVVALLLLGADLITSLEKGEVTVRTIDQVWALIDKESLIAFKSWVELALPPPVRAWTYTFLGMLAFGVVGVPGVILGFLFARRHVES